MMIPPTFPMPTMDVVQHRLNERRCIVCGSPGLELDHNTGFPRHACEGCEKAVTAFKRHTAKQARDAKAAATKAGREGAR